MRNDIVDILLEIGIPAGVKGFTYIYDALELFDTDTYYSNGKICSLYADIAKKRGIIFPKTDVLCKIVFTNSRFIRKP